MGEKLRLDPKIPISWDGFKMKYQYMDTVYDIEVTKGKREELKLDGKSQVSDTIHLVNDGKTHRISLTIK